LPLEAGETVMHLSTRTWQIGLILLLLAPAGTSRAEDRSDRDISSAASVPWHAPDLSAYTKVLRAAEPTPIDPQKRYDLTDLVDLAEQLNPETRVAWERARQAALAVGLVQSEYSPVLALSALGGYHSEPFAAPKDVAPSGYFRVDLEQVRPTLSLRWLLLDFGRRGGALDAAKERLLAANLGFNRKHQEIVYRV
jgi:outer membrane protein TolC